MYNMSNEFKSAIAKPNRRFICEFDFDGYIVDDNFIQSVTYNNAIITGNDFEIGTAPMATMEIELFDKDDSLSFAFENTRFDAAIGVEVDNAQYGKIFDYISLGTFTVEKAVRDNKKIKLTCVDDMHKFEKSYESTLAYPATLLQIAQDICSKAGISLKNTSFVNSDYSVPNQPVLEGITLRTAIAQIAELAGSYAVINRNGQLEIISIGTANTATITKNNYISFNNKDLAMASIDKVIVKLGAEQASSGAGSNPYYVVDNMFCQNPNSVVTALYNALNGLSYMPYSLRWQGNQALDCADRITIVTDKGTYNTIIGSRKLTYKGGLREEYSAPGKSNTEKNSTGKGGLTIQMEQFKTEVKVLKDSITQQVSREEFDSLGNRVSTTESSITQQAGQIASKVSKNEMSSQITQNADAVKIAVGQIGGNQLLKHTDFSDVVGTVVPSSWVYWGNCSTYFQQGQAPYAAKGTIYIQNNTTNPGGLWQYNIFLKPNTKYTFSYNVSKETNVIGGEYDFEYMDGNGNIINTLTIPLNFDGARHFITFTTPSNFVSVKGGLKHYGSYSAGGGYLITFTYPKLEEGENVTAWSPHANEIKTTIGEFTDDHFRVSYQDGSYTEMNAQGFKWHNGSTSKDYHYLIETGRCITIGDDVSSVWVQLPDEFKGKPFKVTAHVEDTYNGGNTTRAIQKINTYVTGYDYANARVGILGYRNEIDTITKVITRDALGINWTAIV